MSHSVNFIRFLRENRLYDIYGSPIGENSDNEYGEPLERLEPFSSDTDASHATNRSPHDSLINTPIKSKTEIKHASGGSRSSALSSFKAFNAYYSETHKKSVMDEYKEWINDGLKKHAVLLLREDPII